MKRLKSESKKLRDSTSELERRRLNWRLFTQNKINSHFQKFCTKLKEVSYPYSMWCSVNEETSNEATVQLTSSSNKTGVVEKITGPDFKEVMQEIEKGAALVASFNSSGGVAFIIYPYKSERYSRKEDNIILYHGISPDDVTDKLIESCVDKYLLYIRVSSVYGTYRFSFTDWLRLNIMIFIDIRNRKKLLRSTFSIIAEWSKIIGAGIAGYIVAALIKGS